MKEYNYSSLSFYRRDTTRERKLSLAACVVRFFCCSLRHTVRFHVLIDAVLKDSAPKRHPSIVISGIRSSRSSVRLCWTFSSRWTCMATSASHQLLKKHAFIGTYFALRWKYAFTIASIDICSCFTKVSRHRPYTQRRKHSGCIDRNHDSIELLLQKAQWMYSERIGHMIAFLQVWVDCLFSSGLHCMATETSHSLLYAHMLLCDKSTVFTDAEIVFQLLRRGIEEIILEEAYSA